MLQMLMSKVNYNFKINYCWGTPHCRSSILLSHFQLHLLKYFQDINFPNIFRISELLDFYHPFPNINQTTYKTTKSRNNLQATLLVLRIMAIAFYSIFISPWVIFSYALTIGYYCINSILIGTNWVIESSVNGNRRAIFLHFIFVSAESSLTF